MSTSVVPPAPAALGRPVLDISGTPAIPFWREVLVELRKSYNTRAGVWYLLSIAMIIALIEAVILIVALVQDNVVLFEDNAFIAGTVTVLLLPVLAIMLVTSEWTQRSAMVSFTLEPRRARVVVAKLVVSLGFVVATLVMMLLVAVVATGIAEIVQPELTDWSFEIKYLFGFAIFQAVTMTIGFAFAALLLNTPAAIVLFFLYWYLLPILLAAIGGISESLGNTLEWINFQVAIGPLTEWEMNTGEEWAKLIVSGLIWIVLPLGLGIARILRAEVK
ncbi:MAG: ABC transporter permease [Propionibacteriales bacterium]|nr:ABC transporter permease [Propionibacteriales bacterium]